MKKVILFLMFIPVMASGQIIENFESGDILNWIQESDQHWKADTLQSITGVFSLHHIFDNSSGGNDCIGIPLANLHPSDGMTIWSFRIRHGYDPSSSNSWAAYLMSDTGPNSFENGSGISGYAVGVNLSGYDDTLRLWKIEKGNPSALLACPVNWQTGIGMVHEAGIYVERSGTGSWRISVYDSENNLIGTAYCQDDELFTCAWFILNYRYSSTRDRLLWLDDLEIYGIFYEDKNPPEITECRVSGINSLDLAFDEEPSDDIFLITNYILNSGSNPAKMVERISIIRYRIIFQDEFINKVPGRLVINQLCDRSGNCTDGLVQNFIPARAEPGDVIISEIMADPVPAVSLPPEEYIEITNRTGFTFNLVNWKLSTEDQKAIFPSLTMNPGEFVIVCSQADTSVFSEYCKTAGLKSFPLLTDGGKLLVLSDSLGNLIHGVDYSSGWYGDALKEGGGWSLEMTDTGFPFFAEGNWEASASKKGGTPGKINSGARFNPDTFFKGIINVFPYSSTSVSVSFSEPLINLVRNYEMVNIDQCSIITVSPADPLFQKFSFSIKEPMTVGNIYSVNLSDDITDFAGNSMGRNTYNYGIPESATKEDIVFNELMFNPYPYDPDYVELRNCSAKILDASRLYLASINTETGDTSEIEPVSEEERCILPGSFYTVTTDYGKILNRYPSSDPDAVHTTGSLPAMPDDKGHLLLLNSEMELIDEVIYTEDMHFALLAGSEGVSLEKIRPEMKSDESISWHSASESSGWGTPGKENSVFTQEAETDDRIVLSSGRISPDNDGYEDVLVIDINPQGTGNVVSVTIFDERGKYVTKVCENLFAGSRASVVWDGSADDGSLVNQGVYIVFIELYNDKGKTKSWKKVCTVIREK